MSARQVPRAIAAVTASVQPRRGAGRRRLYRRLAVLAIAALIVGMVVLAIREINLGRAVNALVDVDIGLVAVALVVMGSAMLFRAESWYVVLREATPAVRPRRRDALRGSRSG